MSERLTDIELQRLRGICEQWAKVVASHAPICEADWQVRNAFEDAALGNLPRLLAELTTARTALASQAAVVEAAEELLDDARATHRGFADDAEYSAKQIEQRLAGPIDTYRAARGKESK